MDQLKLVLVDLEGKETIITRLPSKIKEDSQLLFTLSPSLNKSSSLIKYSIHPSDNVDIEIKKKNEEEELMNEVENLNVIIVKEKDNDEKIIGVYNLLDLSNKNNLTESNNNIEHINYINKEKVAQFYPEPIREPKIKNPALINDPNKIFINVWTFEERELLKKALLSFGYGRWENIKSCFKEQKHMGLREKTVQEIRSYSNSLIKSISDNLNFQNLDLKILLLSIIEQRKDTSLASNSINQEEMDLLMKRNDDFNDDINICVNSRDWDLNSIRQRAKPWAKRLQIMHRINMLMKNFEKSYFDIRGTAPSNIFDMSGILDFIDKSFLIGQKPCSWWTKFHDIHLIYSTYFNGYANYFLAFVLKQNRLILPSYFYVDNKLRRLSWEVSTPDFYSEILLLGLPNADAITRRLKKLVSIIYRLSNESIEETVIKQMNDNYFDDTLDSIPIDTQTHIINFVKDYGIPLNSKTNKESFEDLRSYLNIMELPVKDLENFIHLCKLVSFLIINENPSLDFEFDPRINNKYISGLKSLFTYELAEEFLRNITVLNIVRKKVISENLVAAKFSKFKTDLEALITNYDYLATEGKIFLKLCNTDTLQKIFEHLEKQGYQNIENLLRTFDIDDKFYIINIVELFVDFAKPNIETPNLTIMKKKKNDYLQKTMGQNATSPNSSVQNMKSSKATGQKKVKLDAIMQNQNVENITDINFPIVISSSLKLLNLGEIKLSPYYHSEHNLFPVGFVTVRTYASMFYKDTRCEYTCEILDGGEKPMYKVTSSEDPDHPIVRDSSTGCWIYICKKVNDISDSRKSKITISGTERFGLLDPVVVSLLESLKNAEKCQKYIFKSKKD